MSSAARRKLIERVSARVFCHLEEHGGNPVTIFSSAQALSASAQEKLAKECQWESVMVHHNRKAANSNATKPNELPHLSFYMPSGEQVSFCAHAAMGAALEICNQNDDSNEEEEEDPQDEVSFTVANILNQNEDTQNGNDNDNNRQDKYLTTIYDGDIVALNMTTRYEQNTISQPSMLYRMLRDYCAVDAQDLAATPLAAADNKRKTGDAAYEKDYNYINCHASIARPKTLIPMRSVQDLHSKVIAPAPSSTTTTKDNSNSNQGFALTCKALDDTTGLYLYAKSTEEDGAWECRQFPRASGYPEDPATGIAAAALACHLYHHLEIDLPAYKMYQGTAMGKPSLIVVDDLELTSNKSGEDDNNDSNTMEASFRLLGRVEIDERDTLEIDDDEDEAKGCSAS